LKKGPAAIAKARAEVRSTRKAYARRSLPAKGDASMRPIGLTDRQLDIVYDGARPLQPVDRSRFLEDVATELAGCPDVRDGQLARIVRQVQKRYFRPPQLAESGKYR
jgi:hypothetical protein